MSKIKKEFTTGRWTTAIDVRDFVFNNRTKYDNQPDFLSKPTEKTTKLWQECTKLMAKEIKNGGVLDIDTKNISTITSHKPGYIKKDLEVIFGLQTDKPLKRGIKPFGGIRVVEKACEENGYKLDE
jgi:formate C-acetyltransferase